MRVLIIAIAALVLGTACRGKPAPAPTPTSTVTAPRPSSTTGAPTFATPAPAQVIAAANAATLHPASSFQADGVQRLAWSTNGAQLWIIGTRTIDDIDANTGTAHRVLNVQDPERVLAVLPSGIAVTTAAQNAPVHLIDLASGQTVRMLMPGGFTTAASTFGQGRLLLVSGDQIQATIWDASTGQQTGTLSGFQTAAPVFNVVVDQPGDRAAWVSRGTLQFEDMASSTLGARVSFQDFIGAYAFSPDGKTFATVSAAAFNAQPQGLLQVWDPITGAEQQRVMQPGLFSSVAYAPAQPLLATGGDGFALWSVLDGSKAGGKAASEAGQVRLVSFSPDGTVFITVDDQNLVRLWRA